MIILIVLACIIGYLMVMESTRRLTIWYYEKNLPGEHMGIWELLFVFVPIWNIIGLLSFVILRIDGGDINCDKLLRRNKQSK